jgi:hypothetical protein
MCVDCSWDVRIRRETTQCNIRLSDYTGCPPKNYTLFDFIYRKTYYSYFSKIKALYSQRINLDFDI